MRIELHGDRFIATCKLSEKDDLQNAGWRFDRFLRKWTTENWKKAAVFVSFAEGAALTRLTALIEEREAALNKSYAMYAEADIPVPDMWNHKGEKLDYLPYQKAGILYAAERADTLIADSPGLGKGQPLWAKVLTPTGWQRMGDLVVGDPIIGADGQTHYVTGVFDKGILPVYRVEFNDGAVTHVDGDHLWTIRKRKESTQKSPPVWEVWSTRQLIEKTRKGGIAKNRIEIPLCAPLEMQSSQTLDPYLVGALLGDGGMTQAQTYFYNIDRGVLEAVRNALPDNVELVFTGFGCAYRIVGKSGKRSRPSVMTRALHELGMKGVHGDYKAVPEPYLCGSSEQRKSVLAGLLDTDGSVREGRTRFSSNSKQLRDDVISLVRSLGGTATKSKHRSISGKWHYVACINTSFCPFGYAAHKIAAWRPRIKYFCKRLFRKIEFLGVEEVRCISVNAPDKLYITDDYIVTHNTIQAIGLINYLDLTSGLIVCPATLKLNWKKEMEKWLVDKSLTVGVAYGNDIPNTDFVIVNYDILVRNEAALRKEEWGLLVCDEAQYLQNPKSGRTKVIFGEWYTKYPKTDRTTGMPMGSTKEVCKKRGVLAWYRLMLSGTPMMKRPVDLWPMIRDFDPTGLGKSYYDFAMDYCAGYEGSFGMVADGGSNLEELNEKLRRAFMVRRLKTNVLKDLPPKTREVILLPTEGLRKIIKTERDKFTSALAMLDAANTGIEYKPKMALEEVDPGLMLDTLTKYLPQGFDAGEMDELDPGELVAGFAAFSQARHELALSKLPMAIEHIKRLLDADEKVIVFAIHRDVVAGLYEAFPQAARIIGGMSPKKVEAEKLRFQGDKDLGIPPEPLCNIILGNLKAAGVGHTLTEATVVVFVEMWSVPGDMEQCEDRAHRIGLEHNVLVQYLVVAGTMDAMTIGVLIERIDMIQQGVDGIEPGRATTLFIDELEDA